ncbi:MAG: peptide deformylase [Patescibacteria group bacterium]|nr:peptide deformylase [Patescibacteria group bacterium]MBU2508847.1 peptide deformylase [Patescibacteria group bacterium]
MKTLKIITLPAPSLRQPSKEVDQEKIDTPEFQDYLNAMIEAMKQADGVGLAAPQVGRNERIIVINTDEGAEIFINPVVIKSSTSMIDNEEGCLSVPGVWGLVDRHKKISVRALNRYARRVDLDCKGFSSIVMQHEIDHLDGILFIDKAKEITRGSKLAQE